MSLARNLNDIANEQAQDALNRYLAELVHFYPAAADCYQIEPWIGHQQTYLIGINPPQDEDAWMDLNEAMAAVATDLLVETNNLFVLTTLE